MNGEKKMNLKSGHEVEEVTGEENELQKKLFVAYSEGLVRLHPGGWLYTKAFLKFADRIYDFKFKPSDIIVMTYPKCGTTWMQETLLNMKKAMDLDNNDQEVSINISCPFIEGDMVMATPNVPDPPPDSDVIEYFNKYCPGQNPEDGVFLQIAENSPAPRLLKTHLPFSMFHPDMLDKCKVIFVTRNPKDCSVSYYHHSRVIKAHSYLGDYDQFFKFFLEGSVMFGSYWDMHREAFDKRSHPNFLLAYFEDMKRNPLKEVSRINKFLKAELSDETLQRIVDDSSFKVMKERNRFTGIAEESHSFVDSSKGSFFRKGETGSWSKDMSKEQEEEMEEWIIKNAIGKEFEIKY